MVVDFGGKELRLASHGKALLPDAASADAADSADDGAHQPLTGDDPASAMRQRDFWLLAWVLLAFYLYRLGVKIAHKTGELDGLYDDGGIIYHGDRPLIVVGMTESYSSRGRAIRSLRRMLRAAVDCY